MKTIFTMLYSPAGGMMHLYASAVHRDRRKAYGNAATRSLQINYRRSSFCKSQLQRYCFSRMLFFRQKMNLLSLYNAVNSRDYTNPDDLEIVTLEKRYLYGNKKRSGIYYRYQFVSV